MSAAVVAQSGLAPGGLVSVVAGAGGGGANRGGYAGLGYWGSRGSGGY